MTKQFIKEMKDRLLHERERIEQELEDMGVKSPTEPLQYAKVYQESGGNSDEDNAEEVTAYLDDLSVMEKLQTEWRDVIKALEAIKKNQYGICRYCHKEIDRKRLEARPTSSTCIPCKKTLTQEM